VFPFGRGGAGVSTSPPKSDKEVSANAGHDYSGLEAIETDGFMLNGL